MKCRQAILTQPNQIYIFVFLCVVLSFLHSDVGTVAKAALAAAASVASASAASAIAESQWKER